MRRELSSRYTLVYRWVIPGFLTLAAIIVVWRSARIGMPERPDTAAVLLGAAAAVALMVIARWFDRAKRVWIDGQNLIVASYGREVEVGLGDITSVEPTRFVWPIRVRVRFSRPTKFGDQVLFFPPILWHSLSTLHPGIDDLRRLARAARDGGD